MASDLARAITALVALDREVDARQRDRRLLRKATEQVALLLIERTRAGDEATVNGVVYRTEQVIWPIETEDGTSEPPHPHGARALLRDNKVLVVAERDSRGRANAISVGLRLGPRPSDSAEAATYDLRIASDEDRLAFASEISDALDAFRVLIAADADRLRDASAELVAAVVKLFT